MGTRDDARPGPDQTRTFTSRHANRDKTQDFLMVLDCAAQYNRKV